MRFFVALILLQTILAQHKILAAKENEKVGRIPMCSDGYCIPIDYNKLEAPFKDSEPLKVTVKLDIVQVLELDDTQFTVSVLMDLVVIWDDSRIIEPSEYPPGVNFRNIFTSSVFERESFEQLFVLLA